MKRPLLLAILVASLMLVNCQRLPKERYSQFSLDIDVSYEGDSLRVTVPNSLGCPIHVRLSHPQESIHESVKAGNPYLFEPYETKVLTFYVPDWQEVWKSDLKKNVGLGSSEYFHPDSQAIYHLPFSKTRAYKIIQSYHGSLSHNSEFSRYALDFNLQVGDTICAARDGVVVGVIEGYNVGGKKSKYRPFANFISLYHEDGVITQYVHLVKDGSFIEVGDSVLVGDPIGLSGQTGFTTTPHVHFNVLNATEEGAVSMPVNFSIGPGSALKRGRLVAHPE